MRILVIVPPERFDFYNYLPCNEGIEYTLLWYEKPSQMRFSLDELPLKFIDVIYWNHFTTPNKLLRKVQPQKIIFFEVIDLRQISLIVSARNFGITTFYLEHGAAGDRITAQARWDETTFKQHKVPYIVNRFKRAFSDVIRSKIFYFSLIKGFNSFGSYIRYFKLPFLMLRMPPNKALSRCKFPERVPAYSIVFNLVNYEQFELYTGALKNHAVLTGIPFFDKFYTFNNIEENYIIYIDHPYFEEGLLNWTAQYHRYIAETLFKFAEKNQIKIYIKLHPRSKIENWEKYHLNEDYIKLLQHGDFTELYLKSKLILGFSSSLVTGFLCAKKNIVLLGWHPKPQIFGADFSKTGLCHISFSPEDLETKYLYWLSNNLSMKNKHGYSEFLKKFNFPFDGKATQRVIRAIIENEVS